MAELALDEGRVDRRLVGEAEEGVHARADLGAPLPGERAHGVGVAFHEDDELVGGGGRIVGALDAPHEVSEVVEEGVLGARHAAVLHQARTQPLEPWALVVREAHHGVAVRSWVCGGDRDRLAQQIHREGPVAGGQLADPGVDRRAHVRAPSSSRSDRPFTLAPASRAMMA
ncbi:MAG: hypothetical protein R3B72_38330 [Polyangiaceae bacterium]